MAHQIFRNSLKMHQLLLILLAVVVIFGCNQNRDKETTKDSDKTDGDTSLEDVLPKITLIAPEDYQNKDGQPLEIVVGNAYSGKGEYLLEEGETHGFSYTFFKQHAVEGEKYIFAVAAYNWGGSGTFHYLTTVDKTTLKSVNEVLLGDRVKVESIALTAPNTDTVSINYMDRETGTAMASDPDRAIEKHFKMDQGQLEEVWP